MQSAFYTAGVGAFAHQSKLNILSNNMANINTTAYKTSRPVFADLVYSDMPDNQGIKLQKGSGVKVARTATNYRNYGAPVPTDNDMDFAINGEGYFAVQDLDGEDILYTRDGRFKVMSFDETLYLTSTSGKVVLTADQEPIEVTEELAELLKEGASAEEIGIGVFKFQFEDGMLREGYNNYSVASEEAEPEVVENPAILRGYLEGSNVDMASEIVQVIEAQRAFSYSLKMVQTADEIEQEINTLRRS